MVKLLHAVHVDESDGALSYLLPILIGDHGPVCCALLFQEILLHEKLHAQIW